MSNRESNSPTPSKGVIDHLRRPAVLLLILCSLTFLTYSGTLHFEFVWDDQLQVVNNPLIRSVSAIPRTFTSDLWYHTDTASLYYRPLFLCWSILNYALFGLHPWGWHLGAVLLHVLVIPAVYALARKLNADHWTAAVAAAIFALHPIHVECASWVSASSDTMVTFFYVLAFVAFIKSRETEQPHRPYWALAALCLLAAGLFTKEMALTFAMVAAIYAFLFPAPASIRSFPRRAKHAVWASVPYAVLTFAYLLLRELALHRVAGAFDQAHGITDVLITLPSVLFQYLRLLSLPVGLTALYYTKYVDTAAGFVLPVLGLAIFGVLIWIWKKRTGDLVLPFAAMWWVVTLIPVLYLRSFVNGDFVRDRYVYLPSVGFMILAAKAIRSIPSVRGFSARAVQIAAVAILCGTFTVASIFQQVYWGNELLVFYRGHSLYPESRYATLNFAYALGKQGAFAREASLLADLVKKYPTYARAYYQLTEAYAALGRRDLARQALQKALEIDTTDVSSATGMANLVGLYIALEDYDRAREVCSQVLAREPDLYTALYNCGYAQFLAGNDKEAEKLLSHAVQIGPDLAEPNYFLGRTLLHMGQQAGAEKYLTIAAAIQPRAYECHFWLGQALEMRGAVSEARKQYLQTLKWKPDSEEAKQRLAALDRADPPSSGVSPVVRDSN